MRTNICLFVCCFDVVWVTDSVLSKLCKESLEPVQHPPLPSDQQLARLAELEDQLKVCPSPPIANALWFQMWCSVPMWRTCIGCSTCVYVRQMGLIVSSDKAWDGIVDCHILCFKWLWLFCGQAPFFLMRIVHIQYMYKLLHLCHFLVGQVCTMTVNNHKEFSVCVCVY